MGTDANAYIRALCAICGRKYCSNYSNCGDGGTVAAKQSLRSRAGVRALRVFTLESVHHALDLCVAGGVTRQGYFDRQLAAMISREEIPVILTENVKDFAGIESITTINPFA